jgi:radical SAM superfamily enzyme
MVIRIPCHQSFACPLHRDSTPTSLGAAWCCNAPSQRLSGKQRPLKQRAVIPFGARLTRICSKLAMLFGLSSNYSVMGI